MTAHMCQLIEALRELAAGARGDDNRQIVFSADPHHLAIRKFAMPTTWWSGKFPERS
jgi:hypothetical protein